MSHMYYYQETIRVQNQSYSFDGEITVDEYKGIISSLTSSPSRKSLITPLRDLLKKSNISPQNMDGLLIVGGMGRLPIVEDALKEFWGNESAVWVYNPPDHAVVTGAALYSLLRKKYPGFTLSERAADAYYVRLKDKFDLILSSNPDQVSKVKDYKLAEESDRLLLQIFAGEEPGINEPLESIYHTLIYQGGTSINLDKRYPKDTPVFVQMLYKKDNQKDHTKLPWVYVWLEKLKDKPDFVYHYSDFIKEAHNEKSV